MRNVAEDLDDDEEEEDLDEGLEYEEDDDRDNVLSAGSSQFQTFERRSTLFMPPQPLNAVTAGRNRLQSLALTKSSGDKSIRPCFLKERAATLKDTPIVVAEPNVPQSKAGAFLLSVMAKTRGSTMYDMQRSTIKPLRANVGTLSFTNPKKEQGIPLREPAAGRRKGAMSASSTRNCDLTNDITNDGTREKVSLSTLVHRLRSERQHLHRQMEIFHEILQRLSNPSSNDGSYAEVCKELVDAGLLKEIVTAMREFRFDIGMQSNAICILSQLSEASKLYAYMMSEEGLEPIILQTISVHAAQERLVMMSSTLYRIITDSKTRANINAYKDLEAEKTKFRNMCFGEVVATGTTSKSKYHTAGQSPVKRGVVHSVSLSKLGDLKSKNTSYQVGSSKRTNSLEENRLQSRSAIRLRQALDSNLMPPVLSAAYHLQFTKRPNTSMPPLSQNSLVAREKGYDIERDTGNYHSSRPIRSPMHESLSLRVSADALAMAAYGAAPVFVEPSPLLKRMTQRSASSGTSRRLLMKKNGRSNSIPLSRQPVLADTQALSAVTDQTQTNAPGKMMNAPAAPEDVSPAEGNDDEDSYEDDFASSEESNDGIVECINDAVRLESDTEFIDMLHHLTVRDGANDDKQRDFILMTADDDSAYVAARCIQRYARGYITRRKMKSSRWFHRAESQSPGTAFPRQNDFKLKQKERRCYRNMHGRQNKQHTVPPPLAKNNHAIFTKKERRNVSRVTPKIVQRKAVCKDIPMIEVPYKEPMKDEEDITNAPQSMFPAINTDSTSPKLISGEESCDKVEVKELDMNEDEVDVIKRVQKLYSQGLQHQKENQLDLAIECYETALRIRKCNREFASIYINLGSAFMMQHKFPQALESFRQAERIQPNNVKAIYNSALALIYLGKSEEATQQLRQVLILDRSHAKAQFAIQQIMNEMMKT